MIIPFSGLALGHHDFEFDVDETLFKDYDYEDISSCRIKILIDLERTERMLVLNFRFKGTMELPCDRCLDPIQIPIDHKEQLIVNFGHANNFEDEVWEISSNENQLDLKDFIYETLVLVRPISLMHDIKDCNPDMLAKLQQDDDNEQPEDIDPRWEKLKNLKNKD